MSKTVLIADDEPNIVVSLEYLLQRAGYQVIVARNGEEALASVALHRPDMILLDVMLPLKSGFEVLPEDPPDARVRRTCASSC